MTKAVLLSSSYFKKPNPLLSQQEQALKPEQPFAELSAGYFFFFLLPAKMKQFIEIYTAQKKKKVNFILSSFKIQIR